MIQTTNLLNKLSGKNRDIDPNAMISPNGNAPINVIKKSFNVCRKPTFSASTTTGICSMICPISVTCFLL